MPQRSVRPLDAAALKALTTERLLEYRSRLLQLEGSSAISDLDNSERASLDPAVIHFKDDARWNELYSAVKLILAQREHVG